MIVEPFDRLEVFTITTPAGTAKANPVSADMIFDPGQVVGLDIVIPRGHSGLTGIAIATAHQPVIPWTRGGFITGDDDRIEWALHNQPDTGNWQALTYNTDKYPHSFYLRFHVVELSNLPEAVVPAPLQLLT